MSNLPVPADGGGSVPAILDRAGPGARFAADEFFRAQLGNPHTRAAYTRWVLRFLAWCEAQDVELARITPWDRRGLHRRARRPFFRSDTVDHRCYSLNPAF